MRNRVKKLIDVNWKNLLPIQPEDAKIQNNLDALKSSLKKHGFSLPFAVWIDNEKIYTVDGHTRVKALKELQSEGVNVPEKLKAFEIDAVDRKEAIQILVEVFNQKRGLFAHEELINFLEQNEVVVDDLDVIEVSFENVQLENLKDEDDIFEEEFESIKNSDAKTPVLKEYTSNTKLFFIKVENNIDEIYIRNLFDLTENVKFNTIKGKSNVIPFEKLVEKINSQ